MAGRDLEYAMKDTFAQVRELGVDSRTISQEDLKEIAPYLEPGEATFLGMEPNSGYADPAAVTQGYASAAGRLGADISLGNAALGRGGRGGPGHGGGYGAGSDSDGHGGRGGGPWNRGLMEKLGYNLPLKLLDTRSSS